MDKQKNKKSEIISWNKGPSMVKNTINNIRHIIS